MSKPKPVLPQMAVPIEEGKKYLLYMPDLDWEQRAAIARSLEAAFPNTVIGITADNFALYEVEE
jgi:hypothetical protein